MTKSLVVSFLMRWQLSPHFFFQIWFFMAPIPAAFAAYIIVLLAQGEHSFPSFFLFILMISFVAMRVWQMGSYLAGSYWVPDIFRLWQNILLGLTVASVTIYGLLLFKTVVPHPILIGIFIVYSVAIAVVEYAFGSKMQRIWMDDMVVVCLGYIVAGDSTSWDTATPSENVFVRTWSRFRSCVRRRTTGPIALPVGEDSSLELGASSVIVTVPQSVDSSAWHASAKLLENLTHWSQLSTEWNTHKALWITAEGNASSDAVNVAVVDVSQTRHVFWPIVHGLASASPEYRKEIGEDHYRIPLLARFLPWCPYRRLLGPLKVNVDTWEFYKSAEELVKKLLVGPVNSIHKQLGADTKKRSGNSHLEEGHAEDMTRTILIIHGFRNTTQADEIYATIHQLQRRLKKNYKGLGVVIISEPGLLRHVVDVKNRDVDDDAHKILDCICVMHIPLSGPTLYSGTTPTPPELYEKIFLLVVDGIHLMGGIQAERLWPKMLEISVNAARSNRESDEAENLTNLGFARLYRAAEDWKNIAACLSEMQEVTRSQRSESLSSDRVKIAGVLQELFYLNLHDKDIASVPHEHAVAALNVTHAILDDGDLPDNNVVEDHRVFRRRAHRFLNLLAGHLGHLPEELAVTDVVLLSEHPIKHGGFSNVYRGRYKDPDGKQVEVALKVLKIFEDQSDERRRALHDKFTKESLVWHYLKHPNIVKFLGVDSTTFPSPARAMVSEWMRQGSVLKYIAENSPVAPYAIELLWDIIRGLEYLHSRNIVHGDLCGRNILIDQKGRACLTDFGLAAFIESDTSVKSSTRSGSIRWMSPELLLPPPGVPFRRTIASDIWAFGCVCCEIWSEGTVPFSHISNDTGIIFALSDPATSPPERPYQKRPSDKEGNFIRDKLWEFVRWCWIYEASERPSVELISDVLSELNRPDSTKQQDVAGPKVASGSGTQHLLLQPPSSTSSVDETLAASSSASSVDESIPPSPSEIAKGKQRVRFEEETAIVRFGPLNLGATREDANEEVVFAQIFETLSASVRRSALAAPRQVYQFDADHLALRFRSPVEANNFAMTWTVHRFEPYLNCSAVIEDDK